jgi:hypothetical protein
MMLARFSVVMCRENPKGPQIRGLRVYLANLCPLSCLVEFASLGEDFG